MLLVIYNQNERGIRTWKTDKEKCKQETTLEAGNKIFRYGKISIVLKKSVFLEINLRNSILQVPYNWIITNYIVRRRTRRIAISENNYQKNWLSWIHVRARVNFSSFARVYVVKGIEKSVFSLIKFLNLWKNWHFFAKIHEIKKVDFYSKCQFFR